MGNETRRTLQEDNIRTPLKLFILAVVLVFLGCAANKPMCPAQDTIDTAWGPYGPMIMQTEKGAYSEDRHSLEQFKTGDGWITKEEYEAWEAELKKQEEGSI